MRKIRLDDSCLNHLTNIPVGFTRKSSYILRNHIPKILCILLTGGAYAPDATCIATPLDCCTQCCVCSRTQTELEGRTSSRGKSPVVKQQTLPTMPQRHMWLHRLLFFLERPNKDLANQQQQQQQREAKTAVLGGAGFQLPPTAVNAGLVQPKVSIHSYIKPLYDLRGDMDDPVPSVSAWVSLK